MGETTISSGPGPHPDVDQWIAYHGGELAESEQERLRGHLAGCPACVATVLDLEAFAEPWAENRSALSEFEMAALWRAMKSALPGDGRGASPIEHRPTRRGRWSQRRVAMPTALAASLAAGALGLSLWGLEHRAAAGLRERVVALSEPQKNVPIHDLSPDTATRSGWSPGPTEVPGLRQSTLVLSSVRLLTESETFIDYEVEILDAEGQAVWSSRGFRVSELGTVTLALPQDFLGPGEYRLRLYGWRGESRDLLEDYPPIRIRP